MISKPFRFGVAVHSRCSMGEWCDLARSAEGFGYSSLLLGDHFVDFLPVDGASPLIALAAAGAVTKRLRLGTAMLGNDFRHPVVTAKDAATLDVVTDGRLELGLGAGWLRADYEALGLRYDNPSIRVERLAEAIAVVKGAWTGEPFDFNGSHYAICGYTGSPKPVQQPRPPIVIGGGTERILRLAGREADIVGIHVSTADTGTNALSANTQAVRTAEKIAWVRDAAGDRLAEIEFQMMCSAYISADGEATAGELAERRGISVEELRGSAMVLIGTVDEVCDRLEQRREAWGVSYVAVQAEACASFAPVVQRLSGR